jgi:predicted RNA-binding Zn-ribbon protein involved in translation (DUF1610 family)
MTTATDPDDLRLPDDPLRVICTCGHSARYDALTDFETDGGELTYHAQQDLYAARCPSCGDARPVKVGTFNWDDIGREFCLAFGAFEAEYQPLAASLDSDYDPNRTDFSAVANPAYIARQRFDPICIRCGERLTEEDKRTDGNAPEVGWEYYECPACGHTMHPDSLGTLGDDDA